MYIDILCKVLYCVGTGIQHHCVRLGCVMVYVSLLMQPELCNSIED
jgi:hypothetical protein